MKSNIVLVAALCASSIVMSAQTPPQKQVPPTPQALFDKMQTNVGKITRPAEKERWQANVAMWQLKLSHAAKGTLDAANLAKMQSSFETMKANVAKITEAGEKDRWQINCDLWQFALASMDKMTKADVDKMDALLVRLKTNVAAITEAAEKTRWQANRDLWQSAIHLN